MSDFSATDVAFSGIRFVRERPRTVAIWAGVQILISLVFGAIVVGLMGPELIQLQSLGRQPQTDPTVVMSMFSRIMPMYALILVISLMINAVVYAAMARAVLRPGDEGVGYLRLGGDEVRQILLMLLWVVVAIGGEIVGGIVLAIPAVILTLIARSAAPLVAVLCVLVALGAIIFCVVRLSLASAMTFDRKRVDLFGSWRLTKGHFWQMLGAYALVVGVALLIVILVSIISAAVAGVLGGIGGLTAIFSGRVASVSDYFAPARLGVSFLWAIVTPLFWALFLMPPAQIYRHLSGAADPALDPSTFD